MRLSIVIPVLNEADGIRAFLASLQDLRAQGHEIIIADGGSRDDTAQQAGTLVDQIIQCPAGRALQMNAGAAVAHGDILFFLHADSLVPANCAALILNGLAHSAKRWGRFDIKLSGKRLMFRVVERFMNMRSRWTGISTGDQGLFVERKLFHSVGGFPSIPLMEDIAMSTRLKRVERPLCLVNPMVTSSRRWEQQGLWRTIWLMWRLRFAYWRGIDPAELARIYYPNSARS